MAKERINSLSTENVPDTLYIREKIDEISRHHAKFKADISDVKSTLDKIENTLVGSTFNGNKGIVDLIDKIDDRLYEQEKQMILVQDAMTEYKWTARIIITSLIGFIFWFIKTLK